MCVDRQLDADLQEDFLDKIGKEFGVDSKEASDIFYVLLNCMDYRRSVSSGTGVFLTMEYLPLPEMITFRFIHLGSTERPDHHLRLGIRRPSDDRFGHFDFYTQGYFYRTSLF